MVDIRKIIIIFVVGILFSVFVFSFIEAVYPSPEWDDFCKSPLVRDPGLINTEDCPVLNVSEQDRNSCAEKKGTIAYERDSNGCAIAYYCDTCNINYDTARDNHSRYVFYISALLALVAIFVGMYLPAKENSLNEWIGTGFMLGGAFALFFGTMQSFQALDRIARPIVILAELIIVIFIAYKKVGNLREDKKKT